jgi:hypothetical protein
VTGLLLAPIYLDALPEEPPALRPLPEAPGACPEGWRGRRLTQPLELVAQASTWRRWQARGHRG